MISNEQQTPTVVIATDADKAIRNVETNGRLFCILICVCDLVAAHAGYGPQFMALAILAAMVPGAAVIADQIGGGRLKAIATVSLYAVAAIIAIASFLSVNW